jgi:glycosyltransferase involved in cell wall biosynthesis
MKQEVEFEVLFVNDGSSDQTLKILQELRQKDKRMKYISFSRNFGKEAAMYAGLEHSKGDYVAILDADLQHPPAMLIDMYHGIADEGYDSVAAKRVTRAGEPKLRSFFSRKFYTLLSSLSKIQIVEGSVDYRLMTRQMVEAILKMSERNRFTKGIFGWIGFHTKWIDYENVERAAGETKWSFFKLLKYSMEGIIGFSTAPLAMSSVLGLLFCLISFLAIVYIIIKTLIWGDPTSGWPSLACLILMVGGIQLFCMGILGQYLGKAYIEVKNRPIYLASKVEVEDEE